MFDVWNVMDEFRVPRQQRFYHRPQTTTGQPGLDAVCELDARSTHKIACADLCAFGWHNPELRIFSVGVVCGPRDFEVYGDYDDATQSILLYPSDARTEYTLLEGAFDVQAGDARLVKCYSSARTPAHWLRGMRVFPIKWGPERACQVGIAPHSPPPDWMVPKFYGRGDASASEMPTTREPISGGYKPPVECSNCRGSGFVNLGDCFACGGTGKVQA